MNLNALLNFIDFKAVVRMFHKRRKCCPAPLFLSMIPMFSKKFPVVHRCHYNWNITSLCSLKSPSQVNLMSASSRLSIFGYAPVFAVFHHFLLRLVHGFMAHTTHATILVHACTQDTWSFSMSHSYMHSHTLVTPSPVEL